MQMFSEKKLSRPKAALSSVSIKNTLEQMQGIVNPSARKRSTHPSKFNFHSSVAVHESPTAAGQRFVDSCFSNLVYTCCQCFLEATASSSFPRRKNHLRLRSVRDLTDGVKRLTACDLTLSWVPIKGVSTRVAYRRGPTLCRFSFFKSCRHVLPIFPRGDFFIELPALEKPFTTAER